MDEKTPFFIKIDDRELTDRFSDVIARVQNPRPMLDEIGDAMIAATKARFGSGTGPDGTPWAPNRPSTLARWLGTKSGSRKKNGELSKKGRGYLTSKKVLVQRKTLFSQIVKQIGDQSVQWGSTVVYAGTQQFGAKKGAFDKDGRGHDLPWGDIPARPFLGVSKEDRELIMAVIARHILPE